MSYATEEKGLAMITRIEVGKTSAWGRKKATIIEADDSEVIQFRNAAAIPNVTGNGLFGKNECPDGLALHNVQQCRVASLMGLDIRR